MRRTLCAAVVAVVALASACSDGGGDDDGSELGSTSSTTPPVAPTVPAESAPGTGVVAIGSLETPFEVVECALEPAADAGPGDPLVLVQGTGTRANGVLFAVEVRRTSTEDAAETFTDLITYTDSARILQVQRSETAGEVTDLRDPDARGTLLRVREGGLSATGIAGPPGTSAPEGPGLVGLALDVTC